MTQDVIHYMLNSRLGIIGWGLILVALVLFLTRKAYSIIAFIIMLVIVVMLARAAIDRVEREAVAAADHYTDVASSWIPDWIKNLWAKTPSATDAAIDKGCEIAGIKIGCEILKKEKEILTQIQKDMAQTEQICKDSPAVQERFGEEGKTQFCTGNPFKNTKRVIDGVAAGAVLGSIASISNLLVPDLNKLDAKPYLDCLYTQVRKPPTVNARSCTYSDPHQWRLCVEFHLQLPHEQLGAAPAALDPGILACRKQAYNLQ
jgi:hypothetical protein